MPLEYLAQDFIRRMDDAAPIFIDPANLHQHSVRLQTVIEEVPRIAHLRTQPSMQGVTTLKIVPWQLLCIEIRNLL